MKGNKNTESDEFEELLYSQNESFILFVKSVLDSANIHFVVRDECWHVYMPRIVPSRIFVRKNDVEKARSLLKKFL
jgi:hypothetical protein